MTDLQLVLTISIPSLLVILSWIQNNSRLGRLEAGEDANNKRIDDLLRIHHSDMLTLVGEVNALRDEISRLCERISLLETTAR